jgi:gamma-glutamylcyclotransferase (GGCT)/AIG2-like uncharacterized protein YtfP
MVPRRPLAEDLGMDGTRRLATYGGLASGRPNHHHVAELGGRWLPGEVRGRLVAAGWGAGLGYPVLVLDSQGPAVDVRVLESADLPGTGPAWTSSRGPGTRRVSTTVHTPAGDVEAHVYVLAASEAADGFHGRILIPV